MKIVRIFYFLLLIGVTGIALAKAQIIPPTSQDLSVVIPALVNNSGLSLKDCYQLALKRSETIAIQKELIKETEGLILQSLSTALPKVAYSYSQKWQDVRPNDTFGGYQPESKFTLTQPLFTGFKEFAAISASKHVGKQRELELKRARQLLLTDVSDAFFLYLNYQEDLLVQKETQTILSERVAELDKRVSLGKSRLSEVASAQAQLLRTEANIATSKGQLEVAVQLLEFLIGQPVTLLQDEPLPVYLSELEILADKVAERPDVQAANEALASYKNAVSTAKSSFYPSVNLNGNAYTKRYDTNEGNDWDAILSVNVPLFNGLSDHGQVKQARAQANEADLRLSLAKRKAWLEIKNAYAKFMAAQNTVSALDKAVAAADKNYMLQADDFKKSLVNNLDVLQALQDLQVVRRENVNAKANARRAYWLLRVVTGEGLQ